MRPQKNKLAPATKRGRVQNFALNLGIACGWLLRWGIRLLKRPFQRKDE